MKCLLQTVAALALLCSALLHAQEAGEKRKKKSLMDYDEADLERLYEEWEKDEEPLEPDELPEHKRPAPKIDMSKFNPSDPESILKMTKKGKTLMVFVTVDGNPTRKETDDLTGIWQTSLQNSHIIAERFIIDDNRAIFMFKDGAQAWEAKEFLINQERLKEVTIENKAYPGKFSRAKEEL